MVKTTRTDLTLCICSRKVPVRDSEVKLLLLYLSCEYEYSLTSMKVAHLMVRPQINSRFGIFDDYTGIKQLVSIVARKPNEK